MSRIPRAWLRLIGLGGVPLDFIFDVHVSQDYSHLIFAKFPNAYQVNPLHITFACNCVSVLTRSVGIRILHADTIDYCLLVLSTWCHPFKRSTGSPVSLLSLLISPELVTTKNGTRFYVQGAKMRASEDSIRSVCLLLVPLDSNYLTCTSRRCW